MTRTTSRLLITLLPAILLGGCSTLGITPPQNRAAEPVTVKIVGLNDFHGNIEPKTRPTRVIDADGEEQQVYTAGAAYLASAVAHYRDQSEYNLVIAAGDLIGGSPLASSIFLDEPAIGAMNRIGLDFNAVGNHEFDRGWQELLRIQQGGCEQHTLRAPCQVETPYPGAEFKFLAANVITQDGTTLFPAYGIKRFDVDGRDVAVGVIGLTLKDTPSLVTPSGVEGLTFTEEAQAINAFIPQLEQAGADAIVVSIHQGLYTEVGYNDKSCGGVSGPLLDILKQVDRKVDVVISGHTHRAYVCDFKQIDPTRDFLVTSASFGGSMLTDITLTIDPVTGGVISKTADNVIVQSVGTDREGNPAPTNAQFTRWTPNAEIAAYVERYVSASRDASQRPVGKISGAAPKKGGMDETMLGNLIADAQLFATQEAGAQIALMNNSGIRVSLDPAEDGSISYGDIYAVQPFGNTLITKSFTGAQLLALLEQQFDEVGFNQTFSVSRGFGFSYDLSRPIGSRVTSVSLNGAPIDPATTYRVTMNSFLAAGGDAFTVFEQGANAVTGPVDLDGMEAYLASAEVIDLPAVGRITATE